MRYNPTLTTQKCSGLKGGELLSVDGGGLTLWTLLAGAVEGLEVQPLAVLAPGARGGLGALAAPPHGAVGSARRPLAPLTPASVYWNHRGRKARGW